MSDNNTPDESLEMHEEPVRPGRRQPPEPAGRAPALLNHTWQLNAVGRLRDAETPAREAVDRRRGGDFGEPRSRAVRLRRVT